MPTKNNRRKKGKIPLLYKNNIIKTSIKKSKSSAKKSNVNKSSKNPSIKNKVIGGTFNRLTILGCNITELNILTAIAIIVIIILMILYINTFDNKTLDWIPISNIDSNSYIIASIHDILPDNKVYLIKDGEKKEEKAFDIRTSTDDIKVLTKVTNIEDSLFPVIKYNDYYISVQYKDWNENIRSSELKEWFEYNELYISI